MVPRRYREEEIEELHDNLLIFYLLLEQLPLLNSEPKVQTLLCHGVETSFCVFYFGHVAMCNSFLFYAHKINCSE